MEEKCLAAGKVTYNCANESSANTLTNTHTRYCLYVNLVILFLRVHPNILTHLTLEALFSPTQSVRLAASFDTSHTITKQSKHAERHAFTSTNRSTTDV